jgi:hypothetical protein
MSTRPSGSGVAVCRRWESNPNELMRQALCPLPSFLPCPKGQEPSSRQQDHERDTERPRTGWHGP